MFVKRVGERRPAFRRFDVHPVFRRIVTHEKVIRQRHAVERQVQPFAENEVQQREVHAITAAGLQQPVQKQFRRIHRHTRRVQRIGVTVAALLMNDLAQNADGFLRRRIALELTPGRFRQPVQRLFQRPGVQRRVPMARNQQERFRQVDFVFRQGQGGDQFLLNGYGGDAGLEGSRYRREESQNSDKPGQASCAKIHETLGVIKLIVDPRRPLYQMEFAKNTAGIRVIPGAPPNPPRTA